MTGPNRRGNATQTENIGCETVGLRTRKRRRRRSRRTMTSDVRHWITEFRPARFAHLRSWRRRPERRRRPQYPLSCPRAFPGRHRARRRFDDGIVTIASVVMTRARRLPDVRVRRVCFARRFFVIPVRLFVLVFVRDAIRTTRRSIDRYAGSVSRERNIGKKIRAYNSTRCAVKGGRQRTRDARSSPDKCFYCPSCVSRARTPPRLVNSEPR